MLVDSLHEYQKRWILINGQSGDNLTIIVENRGRQTFETVNDYKGILSNVTLDEAIIEDWIHYPLQLPLSLDIVNDEIGNIFARHKGTHRETHGKPGVYIGRFSAKTQRDTFVDTTGWGKGQLFINGFNVGRYWPSVGPQASVPQFSLQTTLYVPAPLIRRKNIVMMLELIGPPKCSSWKCTLEFIDHPIFNFTSNN
ncbi:unnamed protein product [Toxocara canis]|uniref:Beta-galactosidase n=1 Tax=Toxocara canis TaxID=6265 RepID=A0A183TZ65_TOXCA|nr:unnamed protein product [Toxocara canis]